MDTSFAHPISGDSTLVLDTSDALAPSALLTVAIPTYRRPELLLKAVQSVNRQTDLERVELLIVDNDPDGSSPALVSELECMNALPVRYFRNRENVGMFGNWNRCIALCRTEWITILNDDDLLLPDYVREMRSVSQTSDSVAFACRCQVQDDRPVERQGNRRLNLINRLLAGRKQANQVRFGALHYFFRNRHYGSLGLLFRRNTAVEMGGFDAAFYPSSDFRFFSALAASGGVTLLQRPLAVYRISVNESLKLETILRWREVDSDIRRQLGAQIMAPNWLKEIYIRFASIHEYFGRTRESQIPTTSARHLPQAIRRFGTLGLLLAAELALRTVNGVSTRFAKKGTAS